MSRMRAALGVLAATSMGAACGSDGGPVAMLPSSMAELTDHIDGGLGTQTEWVVAGSSRLVAQLADGADADLLITADRETMESAVAQGLVPGDPVAIAGNRLVLAVAPGNPGDLDGFDDLEADDLLIGVCAAEVPCGRLADEAAEALGLRVAADTEEPNVRALALKLANGELDAGLVYATDADALDLSTIDDAALGPFATEYLAATLGDGGEEIIDFLRSPEGHSLLTDAGFSLP